MPMTIDIINERIKALSNTEWENYNLWYPTRLVIPHTTDRGIYKKAEAGAAGPTSIKDILANLISKDDFTDHNTTYQDLQNIVSISGIPSSGTGFSQEGAGLKSEKDKNYATITIKFYEPSGMATWRFLQNWREAWKTIKISEDGNAYYKKLQTIVGDGTAALPEGYLVVEHLNIKNDGTIEHLGYLKIAGLIPSDIPFPEVGPGKSRGSEIPSISVKFTASNIVYVNAAGGLYQFY